MRDGALARGSRAAGLSRWLAEIRAAFAFLTRFPVGVSGVDPSDATTGAAAFGVVGFVVGAIGAAPVLAIGGSHPVLAAIAAVAILALIDGGLHLDGLSDTFDALVAPAGAAERARTDPRAGTAGVVAIVIVVGLDIAAVAEIASRDLRQAGLTFVGAAVASRVAAPAWAFLAGRRLQPSEGLGGWFASAVTGVAATIALVFATIALIGIAGLAGPQIALGIVAGAAVGSLVAGFAIRLRRQLDGDGYGFLIETTFAAVLVSVAVLT